MIGCNGSLFVKELLFHKFYRRRHVYLSSDILLSSRRIPESVNPRELKDLGEDFILLSCNRTFESLNETSNLFSYTQNITS